MAIPRAINFLCEHSLVNGIADQIRPIHPKIVEGVAHEFQLDEVEPIPPSGSSRVDTDVSNSEAFIQNLGKALSRFRLSPTARERK